MNPVIHFGPKSFMQKYFVLFLICSGILWTLIPATYHSALHFDPAETLMWGSTFNLGSAKHPPMSGYMLYHFCSLFNFPNFAIYLLSQICVTVGFVYIYKLARCFYDRDKSVMATLLITFFYFYNYETPKFNANIPHLLFMPMMCYYFYRGCTADKWHHWLLLAASTAGACLSKYSAGVLVLTFCLYLLINKESRKILLSPKPYAAGLLFAGLMMPHILYLFKTDFLVFVYIQSGKAASYGYFGQLLALLGVIIAPIACMSAAGYLIHGVSTRFARFKLSIANPAAFKYSACIIFGQGAFLLLMGLCGHRLLTIWVFPLFLTAGIFIMSLYPVAITARTRKVFCWMCSICAAGIMLFPLIYYNSQSKFRYHLRKDVFRSAAEDFYRQQTNRDIPFITGDIWEASMLQNTFKYTVKAAPCSDPLLLGLHAETIARKGALIISREPEIAAKHIKKFFGVTPRWTRKEVEYCAAFGKPEKFNFSVAVLPPSTMKKLENKK